MAKCTNQATTDRMNGWCSGYETHAAAPRRHDWPRRQNDRQHACRNQGPEVHDGMHNLAMIDDMDNCLVATIAALCAKPKTANGTYNKSDQSFCELCPTAAARNVWPRSVFQLPISWPGMIKSLQSQFCRVSGRSKVQTHRLIVYLTLNNVRIENRPKLEKYFFF